VLLAQKRGLKDGYVQDSLAERFKRQICLRCLGRSYRVARYLGTTTILSLNNDDNEWDVYHVWNKQ